MKPRTLILRTAGTNCDAELAHAFELAGAAAEPVHLNRLIESPELLDGFDLPIAHGEGRFVASDEVLDRLESQGQVALRYAQNPNGSMRDIAGICDPSGLVLGLMPHPERFTHVTQHPTWTRKKVEPAGLK